MGWERMRSGRPTGYFYLSQRVAGQLHPVRTYLGFGEVAHRASAAIEKRRRDRLAGEAAVEAERAATAAADRLAAHLREWAQILSTAWMVLTGHHRPFRGVWRKRMTTAGTPRESEKAEGAARAQGSAKPRKCSAKTHGPAKAPESATPEGPAKPQEFATPQGLAKPPEPAKQEAPGKPRKPRTPPDPARPKKPRALVPFSPRWYAALTKDSPHIQREFKDLATRASKGEAGAYESLNALIGRFPELRSELPRVDDLDTHTERAWIKALSGGNALLVDALEREVAELKAELTGGAPASLMEKMLVSDVVVAELALKHALIQTARDSAVPALVKCRDQRVEGCQRQSDAAWKRLELIRSKAANGVVPPANLGVFQPLIAQSISPAPEGDQPGCPGLSPAALPGGPAPESLTVAACHDGFRPPGGETMVVSPDPVA